MTAQPLKTLEALEREGLLVANATLRAVADRYAISLTPALAGLIDKGDPADPIARQFLPDTSELQTHAEELADPIGDQAHEPVKGIVHRYRDRVLLKLVHVCPVYCRFCFRREMVGPGGEPPLAGEALDAALAYIGSHEEIWEVILTGGDPFIVPPHVARSITQRLEAIRHLRVLRWHTRVPIADPTRVNEAFVAAITSRSKTVYVAIHVNHARELSAEARAALHRLSAAGVPLLSQTVLLRGVNDRAEALAELMRTLVELRVKPYYLHQADLAPGTSHFRVPLKEAQTIYAELRNRVSGICLPSFVIDIPAGHGKVPASSVHVRKAADGNFIISDDDGALHTYRG